MLVIDFSIQNVLIISPIILPTTVKVKIPAQVKILIYLILPLKARVIVRRIILYIII